MFGGGGGGMNPRKMKQMMEQMGIDVDELDVEEVVIRTSDDEELVFSDAQVTKMDARGQETYQVVGSPETRDAGSGASGAIEGGDETDDAAGGDDGGVPDEDVELVAMRAGVPEDDARAALEENDGDLAAAVSDLEE